MTPTHEREVLDGGESNERLTSDRFLREDAKTASETHTYLQFCGRFGIFLQESIGGQPFIRTAILFYTCLVWEVVTHSGRGGAQSLRDVEHFLSVVRSRTKVRVRNFTLHGVFDDDMFRFVRCFCYPTRYLFYYITRVRSY